MLNRRELIWSAAFAGAANLSAADSPLFKTITRQPEHYHGWPTLAKRKDDELIAVCSGGRESHVCPFGRVELMRSRDGGQTWSWPEIVLDTPIDDRDAGICETAKGTLLITTFTSLAFQDAFKKASNWPEERVARWNAVTRRGTQQQFDALLGTWMLRSTDDGMTWSKPYRVPLNSPHGPSTLSDGRLLYAGKQLWEPGKKVGVCESPDDGQTWRWLADIPARPGDRVEEYHELHQVEASDGTLIVHIRNHSKQNERETLQTESRDGGKTWSTPHPIGVWGLPSHLLRLKSGKLLMSYGYRRSPFGNQARVSGDNGRTWSDPIVISDDGAGYDIGYPSTVELADGKLLTLWYELPKASTKAVLRTARWSMK
jgi:sialidase-1